MSVEVRCPHSLDGIEPVLDHKPLILCGDFNCRPSGVPYGLASAKFRDAAVRVSGGSFTSARPLVRIDHIFATPHFVIIRASVVRNALSRVSSDHLPFVAAPRVQN